MSWRGEPDYFFACAAGSIFGCEVDQRRRWPGGWMAGLMSCGNCGKPISGSASRPGRVPGFRDDRADCAGEFFAYAKLAMVSDLDSAARWSWPRTI